MEKKLNRSVQPSSKGLVTDKKASDGNNSKIWPRGSKRREPSGGSFSTKNESNRKPIPQRFKNFDKRPRPRGNYNNAAAVVGNENAGLDEDEDAELGSVFLQGSKKQSLNHLLNFHYMPHERQWNSGKNNAKSGSNKWGVTGKHKYNKEQFLQANCQFVVKASGDYKQYINNPDALVEWDLIEQVNVQMSEFPSCPICLYSPVAAKMTHCGHIYCWSCMLHYLSLSDKSSRKCPICFEKVHKHDLKSVKPVLYTSFSLNDVITFKLMKRARHSLVAYPADQKIDDQKFLFNVSDTSTSNLYCKLLLATGSDVLEILERERIELDKQLGEDENAPEKCFIEEATNLLSMRLNDLLQEIPKSPSQLENNVQYENLRRNHLDSAGSDNLQDFMQLLSMDDHENSQQHPTKIFYFYQASDGQHIYLHALNIRMLEHTYGSLEYCPLTVTGRIVEKEGGSMTEDIRNRLRYLQHLPVTCQFELAEIVLNESIVSKETLDEFRDQIDMRKRRRIKRAKEEKRREKKIAEAENRIMGKYPEANIQIDSHYQFPEFDGTGFEAPLSSSLEMSTSPANLSPLSSATGSVESDYNAISFAKMLTSPSQKKQQLPVWPQLKKQEEPKLIKVTGSQCKSNIVSRLRHKEDDDDEPKSEDYVPVPAFKKSFHDAIALAFENATSPSSSQVEDNKGKKKKKNKQKLLFATSMTYGNN